MSPPSPCPPGAPCSAALRAGPLVAEARAWAEHATAHGLPEPAEMAKALDALALSLRCPDRLDTATLLVPSKLVGTAALQPALRALRASGRPAGLPLRLDRDARTGLVGAYAGYDLLGLVQTKHQRWVGALVGHGVSAVLLQVTGDPDRHQTHGLNLAFVSVRAAIRDAGQAGADASTDGHAAQPRRAPAQAPQAPAASASVPAQPSALRRVV